MAPPRTMFEKIWSSHVVIEGPGGQSLLYIDRHLLPSFGDIFFENYGKNGAFAIVLPGDTVAGIRRQLHARPGATMPVDLASQTLTCPDGTRLAFEMDSFRKESLLKGQDEIALTLSYESAIVAFEERRLAEAPWLSR